MNNRNSQIVWVTLIALLVVVISVLHYTTSTMKWQYHLIYMQAYFIPIIIAAFQFGIRGGLGTAVIISLIYFPHIMLQWGGLVDTNLMRFLQIVLFNIIGYVTGLKAQQERNEKERYQRTAEELERSLNLLRRQSEKLEEAEEQLRLADRLAVIGELTASLAHEMRNPLGSIRGAVEILRDELPAQSKTSEFFQILIQETERLNGVVENYLHFTRKQKLQTSRFNISEVLQNVRALLMPRTRRNRVNIELDTPAEPLQMDGDINDFRQVAVNLILNAIQAMPAGGTIWIHASGPESGGKAVFPDSDNKPRFVIRIKDEGSGIPTSEAEKIFQPFYTTKSNGTGLGLAIVKRIVEKNHWQIRIESEVGKGAEFILGIPRAEGPD